MTIKQLIEGVIKENGESPDWTSIAEYFNIHDLYWSEDKRLVSYPIQAWLCTDTWVGMNAFFLDDEFVFLTRQSCRKCNTFYNFESKESYKKVKSYIMSLIEEKEDILCDIIDMGLIYDENYTIEYSTQLLAKFHKRALYKDKEVAIIKVTRGHIGNDVMIQFDDGDKEIVNTKELKFFYNRTYEGNFGKLEENDFRDLKISKILKK